MRKMLLALAITILLDPLMLQGAFADNLSSVGNHASRLTTSQSNMVEMPHHGVPFDDIRRYGAKGDGSTDDTAAIQAAFNALAKGTILFFPAGTYRISAGLSIAGKSNFTILGASSAEGSAATSIRWVKGGDDDATMLEITDTQYAIFENIQFMGNDGKEDPENKRRRTNIGLYLHRGAGNITTLTFRHCSWYFFRRGVQVGHLTTNESNNENHQFYDCEFEFCNNGYIVHWPNAINNNLHRPYFVHCDNGVRLSNQSGPVTVYHGIFVHNGTDIAGDGSFHSLTLINPRTEAAGKFIDVGGSNTVGSITLINPIVYFATGISKNPFIRTSRGGGITVIGGQIGSFADAPVDINIQGAQSATFLNTDFNKINVFAPLDNDIRSGTKISLYGCRVWDNAAMSYVPIADGDRLTQWGTAIYKFPKNDENPSIRKNNWFLTANASPMRIKGFRDGYLGQRFTVIVSDSYTTFVHGNLLKLENNTDFVAPIYSSISFIVLENGLIVETSRSVK